MPGGPGKARNPSGPNMSGYGGFLQGPVGEGMTSAPPQFGNNPPLQPDQTMGRPMPQPDFGQIGRVGNNPPQSPQPTPSISRYNETGIPGAPTGGQYTAPTGGPATPFEGGVSQPAFQLNRYGNNPPPATFGIEDDHNRQMMRQMQQGQIGRPQPRPFQGGQGGIVAGEMGGNQRMQGLGSPQFSVGGGYGQAPMMNPMAQQAQQGFFGQLQSMPYRPSFGQRMSQGPMNMPQPLMRTYAGRFYGGGITDLYPR